MKHEDIIFAGFGGQGVLFAGQLLSYAGMAENLHVTWIPSYGPEMRGGTANCTVILSEEEIGAPIIRNPTIAVIFNIPSMEKYEPLVKPGGWLLVNSSLVPTSSERTDIRILYIPASDIATELGNPRIANMVMLGALVGATDLVSLEAVTRQLEEHLSQRQRKWLEPNIAALKKGVELGRG
ncbi:MAG TPA: 2-oxoacid:acceptor oxidoreductase family protein [Anaerolineae bacterium]|nr:2-oxoacid:acceptor oxidoreductase family protein [Anaerolineae bacterium]HQH39546.1 2-oxoacid:acceptor oxidoreductase family protein [Anaerolineae bacterium]